MHQLDIDTLEMLGAVFRREQEDMPLEPLPSSLRDLIAQLGDQDDADQATGDPQS